MFVVQRKSDKKYERALRATSAPDMFFTDNIDEAKVFSSLQSVRNSDSWRLRKKVPVRFLKIDTRSLRFLEIAQ